MAPKLSLQQVKSEAPAYSFLIHDSTGQQ